MTVLVTAASGHLGRLVVESLLARGAQPSDVIATARDTASLTELAAKGVRTAELDYAKPETVTAALEGVDTVLLISASEPGGRLALHRTVIDAAVAAGVEKFVYTSAPKATTTGLVVAPDHKDTEEAIVASGLPAVVLRNNWYTENYLPTLGQAAATGTIASSAGDGRVASASREDFAEATAAVLLEDGHIGQVYELGGDVAWDFEELAAAMSEVLGRPVALESLTSEQHRAALESAGLDAGTIGFLIELDRNIANGDLADTDGTLSRLIGRPTTPIRETLAAIRP
jgi:NAD(P)H dehydrogenase (quinone)